MSSAQIAISSSAANQAANAYTFNLPQALNLSNGEWQVAVSNYDIWYTTTNISAAYGNNTMKYYNGSTWKTITFADGNYQVIDIDSYMQNVITANGDTASNIVLTAVQALSTCMFSLANGYQVDLTVGGLHSLIGFNAEILTTTKTGENPANISNGFTSFIISCPNLVNQTMIITNGLQSSTVYTDSFTVPPNYLQSVSPTVLKYLPVSAKVITSVTVSITDQNGNPLNFNQGGDYTNNASTVTLYFRRVEASAIRAIADDMTKIIDLLKRSVGGG